jgi:hypothetical protein
MEIGTLYVEELRATMRGRFALVGAGVILLARVGHLSRDPAELTRFSLVRPLNEHVPLR